MIYVIDVHLHIPLLKWFDCAQVAFCCFQGMKPSGLCFAGMLIHFRSGKFQVLDLSTFSKSHAEIFREFRHDLCYKLGHIECPRFAAPGRSQRSCKTIGLFMSLFILLGLELID